MHHEVPNQKYYQLLRKELANATLTLNNWVTHIVQDTYFTKQLFLFTVMLELNSH